MTAAHTNNRQILVLSICTILLTTLLGRTVLAADAAKDARNDAAPATKTANGKLLSELPFNDKTDFENAHKGLLAPLPAAMIKGTAGNLIWDPGKYAFIKESAAAPDTVNPSLWRQ